MKKFVISLPSTPDRLQAFYRENFRTKFEHFSAIAGAEVPKSDYARYIDDSIVYRPGALGNALSHQALWDYSIRCDEPVLICEDDARLHLEFDRLSHGVLSQIGDDWDFIAWGWNFDSILQIELPAGLGRSLLSFDENSLRRNYQGYLASRIRPEFYRLSQMFGSVCYSISPRGAAFFLSRTRPISRREVFILGLRRKLLNVALDITMNEFYKDAMSFVCFPPLCITENLREFSTVESRTS